MTHSRIHSVVGLKEKEKRKQQGERERCKKRGKGDEEKSDVSKQRRAAASLREASDTWRGQEQAPASRTAMGIRGSSLSEECAGRPARLERYTTRSSKHSTQQSPLTAGLLLKTPSPSWEAETPTAKVFIRQIFLNFSAFFFFSV